MPRLTDEEVYIDLYISHLKTVAPPDGVIDTTPFKYPPLTAQIPEFSTSTLFINRHVKLSPYAKEALYIQTGFTFTTKVIITEKAYFTKSRAIRTLTIQSCVLRDHGQITACVTDIKRLFNTIRKLHHRELSTFTTYREPKAPKPKSSRVRSENKTKAPKLGLKSGITVDDIMNLY